MSLWQRKSPWCGILMRVLTLQGQTKQRWSIIIAMLINYWKQLPPITLLVWRKAHDAKRCPILKWSGLPTLWRSCSEFWPSMENPHGHGGFLSPKNGACMTSWPLPDAENESVLSPTVSGSQKGPGKRLKLTRWTAGHMKWVNRKW